MYRMYFENGAGERRLIAEIDGMSPEYESAVSEARRVAMAFCAERNFRVYYIRQWKERDETWFDVGSHTEFFILKDPAE